MVINISCDYYLDDWVIFHLLRIVVILSSQREKFWDSEWNKRQLKDSSQFNSFRRINYRNMYEMNEYKPCLHKIKQLINTVSWRTESTRRLHKTCSNLRAWMQVKRTFKNRLLQSGQEMIMCFSPSTNTASLKFLPQSYTLFMNVLKAPFRTEIR
jgi:hypothetical protein